MQHKIQLYNIRNPSATDRLKIQIALMSCDFLRRDYSAAKRPQNILSVYDSVQRVVSMEVEAIMCFRFALLHQLKRLAALQCRGGGRLNDKRIGSEAVYMYG